jgi:hypothetical protein
MGLGIQNIIKKSVEDFVQVVLKEKDLTSPFPAMPWELIHKEELNNALVLSRITNTPVTFHLDFTKEKQELILRAALEGNKPHVCAALARVQPRVLQRWLDLGERGISPYKEFYYEYNLAEALAQARDVRTLREGGWRGALELLKLRWQWQEPARPNPVQATQININETTVNNSNSILNLKGEAKTARIFELIGDINTIPTEAEIVEDE